MLKNTTVERIAWIDIAKAIAIILVVLGHCPVEINVFHYIYTFHIPLFFFIAGCTFRVDTCESFIDFTRKKFLRLMIPYYSFGLMAIVIFYSMNKLRGGHLGALDSFEYNPTFLQMIRSLLYGSGENHVLRFYQALWFLPCMFSVYMISYFIYQHVLSYKEKYRKFIISCYIALFILLTVVIRLFCPSLSLPFGLVQAVVHTPFFLLAIVLRSSTFLNAEDWVLNLFFAFFLVLLGLFVSYGHDFCIAKFKLLDWHVILLSYVIDTLSCLGYIKLCMTIRNSSFLAYIGRQTLPILVLHKYPIVLGDVLFPHFRLNPGNLGYCVFLTIFAVVTSVFVGLFLDRFFPFLYGKPFRKQKNAMS